MSVAWVSQSALPTGCAHAAAGLSAPAVAASPAFDP